MRRVIAFSVALLALAGAGLHGIGAAFGQIEETASPARGDASVIAQGVAAMPAGELGWRVTRASAASEPDAPTRTAPGFVLADQGALLLNHLDAESQTRLASGEAAFLPAETRHEEVVLGDGAVSFYRIDMVAASDVNTAGGDELLFIGEPFASPGGNRDVDLVRETLDVDESVELALGSQAMPVLLLVTSGALELVPADNDAATPVSLLTGQGAALGGDVIARAAGGAGATFVTANVGPEVPAILEQAVPTPTPLREPASLTVQALVCPVAYEGTAYAADCVEPAADVTFDLSSTIGAFAQGTTGGDGAITFVELLPDTYSVTGGVPGEFAQQVVACANDLGPLETGASATLAAGATFAVAAGDAVTCQWYVIPEDLVGEGEGTITVAVYVCPGTPIDPAVDCAPVDASGVAITGPETLTTDAATGVFFGTYFLQTDGIAVPDDYELSEVRGSLGASDVGWTFTVDETTPDAVLAVIYVPAGGAEGDADEDTDGLTDAQEAELGADPTNPDTDGDGLFDGPEVAAGTSPVLYDSDGDGFGDNQEIVTGADPNDPASVPQGDSGIDTDGDLLSDAQEDELGTNAATPDTDGDGLSDFAEVGFEPGSATGTDPLLFDTDGDGVGDGDEITNGTDPTDPASS